MKHVVILGSTGSIGRQTLDVISRHPSLFAVIGLGAGRNVSLLAEQVRTFHPQYVAVADAQTAAALRERLGSAAAGVTIAWGPEAFVTLAELPEAHTVVAALVGAMGLTSTYAALAKGKRVALANKETMVVAGELMQACARRHGGEIIPVDSEHSAVFQAVRGQRKDDVVRVILTASGGPFRDRPLDRFPSVTIDEALKHPNWDMGAKVTIDSATMMNKGLEVIEARWLFDLAPHQIDIVVHPESIVHALVEFTDGAVLAQLATPDMRAPIAYALGFPERIASGIDRLDLLQVGALTFRVPDPQRYPCLQLARGALEAGKSVPTVLNAANEVAVAAFLERRIPFIGIARLVEEALNAHHALAVDDVETAVAIDRESRSIAARIIPRLEQTS